MLCQPRHHCISLGLNIPQRHLVLVPPVLDGGNELLAVGGRYAALWRAQTAGPEEPRSRTVRQMESHLLMRHYEGFLRKKKALT